MYKVISSLLYGIIGVCQFILNVLWHYHWYCSEAVKEKNPRLYMYSKQQSFIQVVKESWQYRNNE